MNEDYSFLYPIFDDRPEYVLGFEAGKLHEALTHKIQIDGQPVHAENRAQLEMICVYFGVAYRFENSTDGWIILYAEEPN